MRSRTLQSGKYAEKRRKKVIGAVFIWSACVVLFISLIFLILRAGFIQISTVSVASPNNLSSEISFQIKKTAEQAMIGNYFNIIPKSSILFFPKDDVRGTILSAFREIEKVDIRRSGLSSVVLSVYSRAPVALACAGFHEENPEDEECFYMDGNAYAYAPSPASSTATLNRYYIPTDEARMASTTGLLDGKLLADLQKFQDEAARAGLAPQGILVGEGGEYEMYIKGGTIVYFDDRTPLATSLSNLITFWNGATSTSSYDYINLRFGNTIYYSDTSK